MHSCSRTTLVQVFLRSRGVFCTRTEVIGCLVPSIILNVQQKSRSYRPPLKGQHGRHLILRRHIHQSLPKIPHTPASLHNDKLQPVRSLKAEKTRDSPTLSTLAKQIEPFIPSPLQVASNAQSVPEGTSLDRTRSKELSRYLFEAQEKHGCDLLAHLALVEGRWRTVKWIMREIWYPKEQKATLGGPNQFSSVKLPSKSLERSLNFPIQAHELSAEYDLTGSLEEMTDASGIAQASSDDHWMRTLGQIWRSLGSLILRAATSDEEQKRIMPHVLEIIADLHHKGIIPNSIYSYNPPSDSSLTHQPPLLHLLSSRILASLSDAAWKGSQSAMANERIEDSPIFFFGIKVPGVSFGVNAPILGPEVWLELVLWCSLYGGWVKEGTAILEDCIRLGKSSKWTLLNWQNMTDSRGPRSAATERGPLINGVDHANKRSLQGRQRVERTISGELVAAYVEALISSISTSSLPAGSSPTEVVRSIKMLKYFLDQNDISLKDTSWDSVVSRLMEVDEATDPDFCMSLSEFYEPSSEEKRPTNNYHLPTPLADAAFSASSINLAVLHHAIKGYIRRGDLKKTLHAFNSLQGFSDRCKRRSLEEFFIHFKLYGNVASRLGGPVKFDSTFAPVTAPGFNTQIPLELLAELIDMFTERGVLEFVRWLLYSDDLDGPQIPPKLYGEDSLVPALVRFGSASSDDKLLNGVARALNQREDKKYPPDVFLALLLGQVTLRRWRAVERLLKYVLNDTAIEVPPRTLADVAREVLRAQYSTKDDLTTLSRLEHVFVSLGQRSQSTTLTNARLSMTVLGILSSLGGQWITLCSGLWNVRPVRQRIEVNDDATLFNILLGAIVRAHGVEVGMRLCKTWCRQTVGFEAASRASHGTEKESRTIRKYLERESTAFDVDIGEGKVKSFTGRITPNQGTVSIITRKLAEEHGGRQSIPAHVTEWARANLQAIGEDYDEAETLGLSATGGVD